ncbi:MAG: folate hydrolase, partial [Blastocatellia bacterium]|nr:folate hydrolase [Blastocatellia bacterium]
MRYLFSLLILCFSLSFISHVDAIDDRPLLGFSREGAAQERALEAQFDAGLKKENLREWMKRITARPHHLGSPYGKENAEFIASQFRSWGYETEIERF